MIELWWYLCLSICVFPFFSIGIIVMNIIILSSFHHIFYLIAITWQFYCMILRCVAGCLVPICVKLCFPRSFYENRFEERCVTACCVTSLLVFTEFIIQIIMLIANLVAVDNQIETRAEIAGIILSGIICVFVLVCLVIHSCTCVCVYKDSELDWISKCCRGVGECCEEVGESCRDVGECCRGVGESCRDVGECCEDGIAGCSRAVTRCCKLCRRRERHVEIRDVPQVEPVPPYDTINKC